jgi:hypothetical protein
LESERTSNFGEFWGIFDNSAKLDNDMKKMYI